MEIRLSQIRLESDPKNDAIGFEKFYDNSYKAAIRSKVKKSDPLLSWEATFFVEDEDEDIDTEYVVNTKGNFMTYLNLDGFLEGEILELDEEVELHFSVDGNSILEALTFLEIQKLKVLPEEKLKALEYSLFPKFAKGYIATDLKQDSNVSSFMEIFYPLLNKFEILKEIKVEEFRYKIVGGDEDTQEKFKSTMGEYLFDKIRFIYYDKGYGEFLAKKDFNELLMAGTKYNPDTTMLDMYE